MMCAQQESAAKRISSLENELSRVTVMCEGKARRAQSLEGDLAQYQTRVDQLDDMNAKLKESNQVGVVTLICSFSSSHIRF